MVRCVVVIAPLRNSTSVRYLGMGLAGPVLLAAGWVLMGHVQLGPLWTAGLRVLPAGILLLAASPSRPRGVRAWSRTVALGLVNVAGFFACQALSLQWAPMGVAATVTATQVLVVPLAARLVAATRVSTRQLCVAAVGVVGVGLILVNPGSATDGDLGDEVDGVVAGGLFGVDLSVLGVAVATVAAVCSAFGLVLTGHWGVPNGMSAVSMTGWQLTVGGLILVPIALVIEGGLPAVSGSSVAVLAGLVVATAAAFGLMFHTLHTGLPAVVVSRLMLMIPVLVTIAGWAIYGQALTFGQGLGLVVVLGSVTTLTLSMPARPRREPSTAPAERR